MTRPIGEPGVSSGHLMMIEQPAASDAAILRTACVTGKFQGEKPATGPIGSMDHHVAHAVGAGRDDAAVGALPLAGEPVDDVGGAQHLHLGLRQDLALLLGEHLGDLVGAGAHEVGGLAQDLAALEGRHPAPGLEALVDGGQRLVEVALGDVPQLADRLAVGGVDDVLGLGSGGLDPVAVDVVLEGCVRMRFSLQGYTKKGVAANNDRWGRLRKQI